MARIRNHRTSVLRPLLILILLAAGTLPTHAADTGRLLVFLEVPPSYSDAAELTIGSLELLGDGAPLALAPRHRAVAAADLAGQQILLAEAELPAGHLDSLVVRLLAVRTLAGVAEIQPPVRPAGYVVPIDTDLARGEAAVLRLRWEPGAAPAEGRPYALKLTALHEVVPPLGSLAFVSDGAGDCVLIVDRLAGRVAGALVAGADPRGLAYSRLQQQLYVAAAGEDGIGVIDGLTLRLTRTVPLQFGDEPDRLALSPDGSVLYVLNRGSRTLVAMATWSMQEQARANVGVGPRSLAVDPQSGTIYVACEDAGEVQVFGSASLEPLSSLTFTTSPSELAFDPASRRLFAASSSERRLFGLDFANGRDLGGQGLCGLVAGMAYSPKSQQLFASLPSCGEVAVLRPADGLEFAPLALGAPTARLAFDPEYRQLLVLLPDSAVLAICNPYRGSVTARVPLVGRPHSVVAP